MKRREMTHLMATEAEAEAAMLERRKAAIFYPPMFSIADIRVERRQPSSGEDGVRWVVTGDYSAWP